MMKCTPLSINATLSSGVSGKDGNNDRIQTKQTQITEKGYFFGLNIED